MKKNLFIRTYMRKYIVGELVCGLLFLIYIGASLIIPLLMKYFIDSVLPSMDIYKLFSFSLFFLAVYVITAALSVLVRYRIIKLENKIITEARAQIFSNMVYQPLTYYRDNRLTVPMERILRDIESIRSLWGFLLPSAFSSIVTFAATFVIIIIQDWIIALLSLSSVLVYIIIFKLYNEKLRSLHVKVREDGDSLSTCVTDAWNGSREIKAFQYEASMISRFNDLLKLLKNHNISLASKEELSKQLMSLATTLGTLVTLCAGGVGIITGRMTLGTLIALQSYVAKLFSPAEDIADIAVDFKKIQVNIERFSELLYADIEDASCIDNDIDNEINDCLDRGITFDKVSFSYNDNEVLKNLSFKTNKDGVYAFAGKSGAGKTTILNMLLGFSVPQSGVVSFGKKNLSEIPLANLRKHVSVVSQSPYLFNISVYDNIKISNLAASNEAVEQAIKTLGIDKMTSGMPDGVHSIISEFGKNMSGGQIQRIAVARAILKNADIFIFDEATSNMDSLTEQDVQSIIDHLKGEKKLIFLVSHRLSSLKNSDFIYFIDNGTIVEEGTFDALCGKGGAFAQLYNDQVFKAVPDT